MRSALQYAMFQIDSKQKLPEQEEDVKSLCRRVIETPKEIRVGGDMEGFHSILRHAFPDVELVVDSRRGLNHHIWFGY